MNRIVQRQLVVALQKECPFFACSARLVDDRLGQGVFALDKEFVALVEPFQETQCRHAGTLMAVDRAISQHQVPHAVDVSRQVSLLVKVRQEMIHGAQLRGAGHDADILEAVEALALLVAVERIPHRGDGNAAHKVALEEEHTLCLVILHFQQVGINLQVPGRFHQPPARFRLLRQVLEVKRLLEL